MAGFTSESVAAFRRNGWLTCVGMSGRLGSEYAVNNHGGPVAVVRASLTQLFVEPVIQWWTVDCEADVGLTLEVMRPDGATGTRRYYVKNIGETVIADDESFRPPFLKSVDTLMLKVVPEVWEFLGRK